MPKICLYCARYSFEPLEPTPLGNGYLAAYLVQQNIVTEDEILIAENIEEVLAFKPDILGISSVSQVINDAKRCALTCKEELGSLTILGGYHISGLPNKLPDEFDIGVIGEGEKTFAEIVELFKSKRLNNDTIEGVKGICYKNYKSEIIVNEKRELIKDLDILPFPRRPEKYLRERPIFTSRGCPYNCTFCASHSFWRNRYRLRSADSVVKEISWIVEHYKPELISIQDDLWMADKARFRKIVEMLDASGITREVGFIGMCRSNLMGEEEIMLFKKMNYQFIRFGGETGSDALLKRIKGKNISINDHQRVVDLCHKHNIRCSASFMAGVPGERVEDLKETIRFLRKNKGKININGYYFFNPVPGTELWESLKKENLIRDDFPFEKLMFNFLKDNFSWDNVMYFNEKNVPLKKFKKIVENIKREFIYRKPTKVKLLRRYAKNLLLKTRDILFKNFKFISEWKSY
jgi:radical SAM superfamily enzyme YgiQ (UPF0313 family)